MNKYILPNARKKNLVVQELPDELLIYDLAKNKAICLNQTVRLILEQCDGKTTLEKAAENISKNLKTEISDEIFWVALEQLKKNNLLDESQSMSEMPKVSRRDLMKSGLALTIALPLVTSLIAPSAIHAQSGNVCTPAGLGCFTDINNMDNCCAGASCTMAVAGTCCIINTIACNPNDPNGFCCPGTFCDPLTDTCMINVP